MTSTPHESAAVPNYLGMVICDNILQDPETKKYFLMGTTAVTYARAFPARYRKMCVYAVLTEVREDTAVTVRLVRVDRTSPGDDEELMAIEGRVSAPDPLTVAELTLGLHNLLFPQAGEYRFQLWSGGTLLGERKFHVRPNDPPGRQRRRIGMRIAGRG